jgi:hypothetical protein
MSHILHGFTDPKYLDVLIAKAEAQLHSAENEEDRQRFAAYLDVLRTWKGKMGVGEDACTPSDGE